MLLFHFKPEVYSTCITLSNLQYSELCSRTDLTDSGSVTEERHAREQGS